MGDNPQLKGGNTTTNRYQMSPCGLLGLIIHVILPLGSVAGLYGGGSPCPTQCIFGSFWGLTTRASETLQERLSNASVTLQKRWTSSLNIRIDDITLCSSIMGGFLASGKGVVEHY